MSFENVIFVHFLAVKANGSDVKQGICLITPWRFNIETSQGFNLLAREIGMAVNHVPRKRLFLNQMKVKVKCSKLECRKDINRTSCVKCNFKIFG